MADRYWASGAGTWNTSSTTVWSAAAPLSFTASSSGTTLTTTGSPALVIGMTVWNAAATSLGTITGGSGNTWTLSASSTNASQTMTAATTGASVPTSADSVFFTRSAAYNITLSGAINCLDLTVSAGTPTFIGSGSLTVYGSFTLATGGGWTNSGTLTFAATSTGKTITTNGVSLTTVVFDGVGGGWTLGSALTSSSTNTITFTNGSFDSGNYSISASQLSSNNSNTRSISLGSSTVTLTNTTATTFNFANTTGLTFNAGTSQLNFTSATATGISSGGLTFYNVSFTAATTSVVITGTNTFNTLAFPARTAVGVLPVLFSANQTISTLTLAAGTSAAYRTFLASNPIGTQRTLAVTTLTAGAADYDFRDIAVTGSAAPLTGTRFGDCKGNSGITFDAPKTVYWRSTASSQWAATGTGPWAFTNGGTADVTAYPLPQDTAIFPSSPTAYPTSGNTVTITGSLNIGTIDMSARTTALMNLAVSNSPNIYGNWINGTGSSITSTGFIYFSGRGTQEITGAGKSFAPSIYLNSAGGSLLLKDNITAARNAVGAFGLNSGTLDLNGYTLSLTTTNGTFITGTGTKSIAFNGGTISIQSASSFAFNNAEPSGFTTTGSGTITMISGSTKSFVGGGSTYSCTLNQGGAGPLTVTGSNTFANLTNTSVTATSILFTAGTNNTFSAFTLSGTAGNLCTLGSTTTSQATLTKSSTWYMGANSTDGGNNTNLVFTAGGSSDYLSVSYINGVVSAGPSSSTGNFFLMMQ